MKPEPFFEAVEALGADRADRAAVARAGGASPRPMPCASRGRELTLLCGHYKDVDQRVAEHLATEELSLGDFVLTGGEPAALAIIDATVRLLPGAMSDLESARTATRSTTAASARRAGCTRTRIADWRPAESERTQEREAAEAAAQAQAVEARGGTEHARFAALARGPPASGAERRARRRARRPQGARGRPPPA